jgi:hypothetical protein
MLQLAPSIFNACITSMKETLAHTFKYPRWLTDHVTRNKYSGQQLEFIIHRRVIDQAFHMAPDEIVQRCQVW